MDYSTLGLQTTLGLHRNSPPRALSLSRAPVVSAMARWEWDWRPREEYLGPPWITSFFIHLIYGCDIYIYLYKIMASCTNINYQTYPKNMSIAEIKPSMIQEWIQQSLTVEQWKPGNGWQNIVELPSWRCFSKTSFLSYLHLISQKVVF